MSEPQPAPAPLPAYLTHAAVASNQLPHLKRVSGHTYRAGPLPTIRMPLGHSHLEVAYLLAGCPLHYRDAADLAGMAEAPLSSIRAILSRLKTIGALLPTPILGVSVHVHNATPEQIAWAAAVNAPLQIAVDTTSATCQ